MEGCLLEEDLVVARAEAARLAQQLADRSDGDSAVRGLWSNIVARGRHAKAHAPRPLPCLISSFMADVWSIRECIRLLSYGSLITWSVSWTLMHLHPDANTCILLPTG